MGNLVYFSTTSENTHRFVLKLGLPALRIPGSATESLLVDAPYVLLVPTYGGGSAKGAVPSPVIRFLNIVQNRQWLRGVIAAGNTNFGEAFCIAGDIIARKCGVPFLYRFELMGTPEDVETVRQGVETFWKTQP